MVTFTLPVPPSVNHYLQHSCEVDPSHTLRVTHTQRARQYKNDAGWLAKAAGLRLIDGPVRVRLDLYQVKQLLDADNIGKVLIDALEGIGYENDSQVMEMHVYKHTVNTNRRVEVTVEALEA